MVIAIKFKIQVLQSAKNHKQATRQKEPVEDRNVGRHDSKLKFDRIPGRPPYHYGKHIKKLIVHQIIVTAVQAPSTAFMTAFFGEHTRSDLSLVTACSTVIFLCWLR